MACVVCVAALSCFLFMFCSVLYSVVCVFVCCFMLVCCVCACVLCICCIAFRWFCLTRLSNGPFFLKYVVLIYAICPLFIMLFSCVGACSLCSLVSWFTDCCFVVVFSLCAVLC